MNIGILGGSFDPIHAGHLLLAESARERLGLDRVLLIPAASPPHKPGGRLAPAARRLAMVRAAVRGRPGLEADGREIRRGGISWTVDTLRSLRAEFPRARLFLIVGSDTLPDVARWREPAVIYRLATLAASRRAGAPEAPLRGVPVRDGRGRRLTPRVVAVEMPAVGISASDLRERVRTGRSIRWRTPEAVERYIRRHGLYRTGPAGQHEGSKTRRRTKRRG